MRKWTGLLKENLDKHNVHIEITGAVIDEDFETFSINGATCALCDFNKGCDDCPLCCFLDWVPCDEDKQPFSKYIIFHDPIPMINALKGTLDNWPLIKAKIKQFKKER